MVWGRDGIWAGWCRAGKSSNRSEYMDGGVWTGRVEGCAVPRFLMRVPCWTLCEAFPRR
jgi:hypothetical protein